MHKPPSLSLWHVSLFPIFHPATATKPMLSARQGPCPSFSRSPWDQPPLRCCVPQLIAGKSRSQESAPVSKPPWGGYGPWGVDGARGTPVSTKSGQYSFSGLGFMEKHGFKLRTLPTNPENFGPAKVVKSQEFLAQGKWVTCVQHVGSGPHVEGRVEHTLSPSSVRFICGICKLCVLHW